MKKARLNFVTASRPAYIPQSVTLAVTLATPLDFYEEAPVNIGLVLTGGGSHGAFEAGVLEAILPALQKLGHISTITGTSAGAVNAIAAGSGLNASGTDEAISRLRKIWEIVQNSNPFAGRTLRFFSDPILPQQQRWPNISSSGLGTIFQQFMPSLAASFISKTVKGIVNNWKDEVQNGTVKIYANTVLGDKHKILTGSNLTPDGVGASANLKPLGFHFIRDTDNPELKNQPAYDGAYAENGSLAPHVDNKVTDCIMIVLHDRRHNSLDKGDLKHAEIHSHALDMAASDSHSPMRFHAIEIESMGGEIGGLSHMDDSSKLNTDPEFIDLLYQAGLKAGHDWLKKNENYIGQMPFYSFYQPALEQYAGMDCS